MSTKVIANTGKNIIDHFTFWLKKKTKENVRKLNWNFFKLTKHDQIGRILIRNNC